MANCENRMTYGSHFNTNFREGRVPQAIGLDQIPKIHVGDAKINTQSHGTIQVGAVFNEVSQPVRQAKVGIQRVIDVV